MNASRVRVVAGSAGGLFLKVPKGFSSRPTQERVKAALFNRLGSRIVGARVLELFAGTGSLGIEALSRGAASVLFVEKDRRALSVLRENLQHCRLSGEVIGMDVSAWLRQPKPTHGHPFDIILMDPPYDFRIPGDSTEWFNALAALLTPNGVIIWEHARRMPPTLPSHWTLVHRAEYGETSLSQFCPDPRPNSGPHSHDAASPPRGFANDSSRN